MVYNSHIAVVNAAVLQSSLSVHCIMVVQQPYSSGECCCPSVLPQFIALWWYSSHIAVVSAAVLQSSLSSLHYGVQQPYSSGECCCPSVLPQFIALW